MDMVASTDWCKRKYGSVNWVRVPYNQGSIMQPTTPQGRPRPVESEAPTDR